MSFCDSFSLKSFWHFFGYPAKDSCYSRTKSCRGYLCGAGATVSSSRYWTEMQLSQLFDPRLVSLGDVVQHFVCESRSALPDCEGRRRGWVCHFHDFWRTVHRMRDISPWKPIGGPSTMLWKERCKIGLVRWKNLASGTCIVSRLQGMKPLWEIHQLGGISTDSCRILHSIP